MGDNVRRLPITGNETVLDAISQVNGLSQVSSKKIWIARPAPHNFGCQQILPIEWDAITQGAQTATNYQLLPGDRLFVAEDELITFSNMVAKVTAPIERLAGIMRLGGSTIRGYQTMGRNYNRNPQWILTNEEIITLDHRFECRWRGPALPDAADNGICPVVYDSADLQPQRPVQSQSRRRSGSTTRTGGNGRCSLGRSRTTPRRLEALAFQPRRRFWSRRSLTRKACPPSRPSPEVRVGSGHLAVRRPVRLVPSRSGSPLAARIRSPRAARVRIPLTVRVRSTATPFAKGAAGSRLGPLQPDSTPKPDGRGVEPSLPPRVPAPAGRNCAGNPCTPNAGHSCAPAGRRPRTKMLPRRDLADAVSGPGAAPVRQSPTSRRRPSRAKDSSLSRAQAKMRSRQERRPSTMICRCRPTGTPRWSPKPWATTTCGAPALSSTRRRSAIPSAARWKDIAPSNCKTTIAGSPATRTFRSSYQGQVYHFSSEAARQAIRGGPGEICPGPRRQRYCLGRGREPHRARQRESLRRVARATVLVLQLGNAGCLPGGPGSIRQGSRADDVADSRRFAVSGTNERPG